VWPIELGCLPNNYGGINLPFAYWGEGMARPRPFLFCRYEMLIDGEMLDAKGQISALTELQGDYKATTAAAERNKRRDSAIIRPRSVKIEKEEVLVWSVVRRIGTRVSVEPDRKGTKLEERSVDDPGVFYSDFIAIPRLGAMAVDDRSGDPHLGGKAAIQRFKAIFEHLDGAEARVHLTTKPSDVDKALKTWDLTEFSFVVRPYNPHPPGDLSKDLSEDFKRDGIGRERGTFRPFPGHKMKPSTDGPIAAVKELADDGYGQYAFKGKTEDGHTAQIKAPQFDNDRATNQRRQAEPRELRVVIDTDYDVDDALLNHVVTALRKFYD
jgi:hypothetical protein